MAGGFVRSRSARADLPAVIARTEAPVDLKRAVGRRDELGREPSFPPNAKQIFGQLSAAPGGECQRSQTGNLDESVIGGPQLRERQDAIR